MSDRTFQLDSVPSYGAHIELVSTTTDGFAGDGPDRSPVPMTHSKLTPHQRWVFEHPPKDPGGT